MKTTLGELVEFFKAEENTPKGEYVLVIEGRSEESLLQEERAKWDDISIKEHLLSYIEKGMSKKEAIKQVALDRDISKRDVYAESIEL